MGAPFGSVLPSMLCWQLFTPPPGTTISLLREFGTTTLNWSLAWSSDMYQSKNTHSLLWKRFCPVYVGGFWRAGLPLRKMNTRQTNYFFIFPVLYYYYHGSSSLISSLVITTPLPIYPSSSFGHCPL